MNRDLTICQLWFRLARVFNMLARESMRFLRANYGVVFAAPSTSYRR